MRKKLLAIVITLSLVIPAFHPRTVVADDTAMRTVLVDAVYGGAVGALLGVGFMLLSGEPEKHWNYLAYGTGGGIIAGAAVGMASSTKALAEIENGKITLNVPEIKTDIIEDKRGEKMEVVRTLSLLRYNF